MVVSEFCVIEKNVMFFLKMELQQQTNKQNIQLHRDTKFQLTLFIVKLLKSNLFSTDPQINYAHYLEAKKRLFMIFIFYLIFPKGFVWDFCQGGQSYCRSSFEYERVSDISQCGQQ